MNKYFKDKTVLVTGAGWGIGAATALLYAAYGANVIVSDTSRKEGNKTAAIIKSRNGTATYIMADVSNEATCEKLIRKTIETYGSIDIACNNSAIFSDPLYVAGKNMEPSDNELGVNLNGLRNCMQYEIEAMQKQGGGIIVNTSFIVGIIGLSSVNQFVEAQYSMAALLLNTPGQYPARGIHINTIAPAFIKTALLNSVIQAPKKGKIKSSPKGRRRMVQEVAGLVLWLSSDELHLLPTVCNDNN
jgi:NAD(P)-dependent dehydrogenase (short-subunit alcohol dehydrogenase family)